MRRMTFADIFYIRKLLNLTLPSWLRKTPRRRKLKEMERILQQQEECIGHGDNIIETDSAFHNLMVKATANRVMERLIVVLIDILKQSARKNILRRIENDERARRSLEGHQRVLAAIKKGDGNAARKSMLQHLEDYRRGLSFTNREGVV